jgi:predicted regulator of Ras-like GTPase activity (Roadblock/LC7/MglB family)
MVFSIEEIQAACPGVRHVVMFYNNGIVFQSSFQAPVSPPKAGEALARFVTSVEGIHRTCNIPYSGMYRKIIYEAEETTIVVMKLGEDSNIALFFDGGAQISLEGEEFRKNLAKIQELIDMDQAEVDAIRSEIAIPPEGDQVSAMVPEDPNPGE